MNSINQKAYNLPLGSTLTGFPSAAITVIGFQNLILSKLCASNLSSMEARRQRIDIERVIPRQRRRASNAHRIQRWGGESPKKQCFLRRRTRLLFEKERRLGLRGGMQPGYASCARLQLGWMLYVHVHVDIRYFG